MDKYREMIVNVQSGEITVIKRDYTAEEIAEMEALMAQIEQTPSEPTPEERIASLEEELKAAKILLGLEET